MLGGLQRLPGTVLRGAAPVQAGAERRQQVHDVLDKVVFDLALVQQHQAPPGRGQNRLNKFDVHPAEAVFVLDHHRGHRRIGQQPLRLRPGTLSPEAISDSTRSTG